MTDRVAAVATLELGDHACWCYSDDAEHAQVLEAFLAAGLAENERILYFGDDPSVKKVRAILSQVADVPSLIRDGKLVVGDAEAAYLPDGVFDPARCIEMFHDAARAAVGDGYDGIRVAGENTSVLCNAGELESWYEYELRVELLTAAVPIVGLCCFDRRQCDNRALAVLDSIHRKPIDGDLRHLGFSVLARADGALALAGEVDSFTVPHLSQVLSGAAHHLDDLVIDVAALEFIDSTGLRLLERLARAREPRQGPISLTGASSYLREILRLIHPHDRSALVLG